MPIFDYECEECGYIFESIEVASHHKATECKQCKSPKIHKILTAAHVRMDPDTVKHNLPDPVPPLEELRGKAVKGSETGLRDKPEASRSLGQYKRRKDKYGNTIWEEKKTQYFT